MSENRKACSQEAWPWHTPKVEHCEKHHTYPEPDEPCWACENNDPVGGAVHRPDNPRPGLADILRGAAQRSVDPAQQRAAKPKTALEQMAEDVGELPVSVLASAYPYEPRPANPTSATAETRCAQCGATPAPYVEHRCMLHYGGQTVGLPFDFRAKAAELSASADADAIFVALVGAHAHATDLAYAHRTETAIPLADKASYAKGWSDAVAQASRIADADMAWGTAERIRALDEKSANEGEKR